MAYIVVLLFALPLLIEAFTQHAETMRWQREREALTWRLAQRPSAPRDELGRSENDCYIDMSGASRWAIEVLSDIQTPMLSLNLPPKDSREIAVLPFSLTRIHH